MCCGSGSSRRPDDPGQVLGNVNYGMGLILINRSDYFQAGLIIAKGSFDRMKARGLDVFRDDIRRIAPRTWGRVSLRSLRIGIRSRF